MIVLTELLSLFTFPARAHEETRRTAVFAGVSMDFGCRTEV